MAVPKGHLNPTGPDPSPFLQGFSHTKESCPSACRWPGSFPSRASVSPSVSPGKSFRKIRTISWTDQKARGGPGLPCPTLNSPPTLISSVKRFPDAARPASATPPPFTSPEIPAPGPACWSPAVSRASLLVPCSHTAPGPAQPHRPKRTCPSPPTFRLHSEWGQGRHTAQVTTNISSPYVTVCRTVRSTVHVEVSDKGHTPSLREAGTVTPPPHYPGLDPNVSHT